MSDTADDAAVDFAPLEALGVPGLIPELIGLFLEDAPAVVEAIRAAAATRDAAALRNAVHQLKGSASGLHARPLAALCSEAERLVRAEELDGALAQLPALFAEYERVSAALAGYSEEPPA